MDAKPLIATGTRLVNAVGQTLVVTVVNPSTVHYRYEDGDNTVTEFRMPIWQFDSHLKQGNLTVVGPTILEDVVRQVVDSVQ